MKESWERVAGIALLGSDKQLADRVVKAIKEIKIV